MIVNTDLPLRPLPLVSGNHLSVGETGASCNRGKL